MCIRDSDFAFVFIETADVVPQVGEGGAGGEAHIAGPEHGYAHVVERSSLTVPRQCLITQRTRSRSRAGRFILRRQMSPQELQALHAVKLVTTGMGSRTGLGVSR